MICYLGIGSNLGDRRANLENALTRLAQFPEAKIMRCAPVLETPAQILPGAPLDWQKPFLNSVVELDWSGLPQELMQVLKKIEQDLGRKNSERWSPRAVDLDLLTFGQIHSEALDLTIPHPRFWERQFVLSALKHLSSSMPFPGLNETVLQRSRSLPKPLPLLMSILNLTPDSFSEGPSPLSLENLPSRLQSLDLAQVHILDFGAESTRPGAQPILADEEWQRLEPALALTVDYFKSKYFRPQISVDTYHSSTAAQAVNAGADMINDVGGLRDPQMIEVLKGCHAQYVLMHSLTIPAQTSITMPDEKLIESLKSWALDHLEKLEIAGISLDRILFDPGLGFGKTPAQGFALLQNLEEFLNLPVRLLIGHSRKSFLNRWGPREATDRDFETLGISMNLASRHVDVLRVHQAEHHQRALRAFQEVQ